MLQNVYKLCTFIRDFTKYYPHKTCCKTCKLFFYCWCYDIPLNSFKSPVLLVSLGILNVFANDDVIASVAGVANFKTSFLRKTYQNLWNVRESQSSHFGYGYQMYYMGSFSPSLSLNRVKAKVGMSRKLVIRSDLTNIS